MNNLIQNEEVNKITIEINKYLKELHLLNSLLAFEKLCANSYIDSLYDYCSMDSKIRWINRHDKLHALTVTLNSIKIFKILKNEPSLRKLMDPRTEKPAFSFYQLVALPKLHQINVSLAEDFCCTSILLSSFCHDIFRFMIKDHPTLAACSINNIVNDALTPLINPDLMIVGYENLLPTIQACVQKHEGEKKADDAEEGLVMISDVIDNDKERITIMSPRDVILNDPQPIEYFSCKNIDHPIDISIGKTKNVDLTVRLLGDAGWHHVKKMYDVLGNSGLGNYISLNVMPPDGEKKIVF